jgi:hypothetical protein
MAIRLAIRSAADRIPTDPGADDLIFVLWFQPKPVTIAAIDSFGNYGCGYLHPPTGWGEALESQTGTID